MWLLSVIRYFVVNRIADNRKERNLQIIEKNADELFELFHFIQKIETDKSFKEIADNKFFADEGPSATDDMCFFHIERLSYDDDYPKKKPLKMY